MHPYNHVFLHRGPSRLFWFLFGAGVATWWHYSPNHRAKYFPCVMPHRRAQDSILPEDPRSTTGWTPEHDREHLLHLQKRASETVADLSESTLDSIISGAESLKAKLAQPRAERDKLEAEKKTIHPSV